MRSDLFGVELHHEPQHAVRRRVLRTHVDDHGVADLVLGPHATAGEHELARTRGAQLLRALVGLALEPRLFAGLVLGARVVTHRGLGSPLNVTGTRAERIVLAERVAVPVVGHEDAREIGMTVERDAEQVVGLALGEVGAGVDRR